MSLHGDVARDCGKWKLVANRGGASVAPLWSFAKLVIAAAVLCLVRDRKLALDELLDGRPFTQHQLLQHQAVVAGRRRNREVSRRGRARRGPMAVATLLKREEADGLCYPPLCVS